MSWRCAAGVHDWTQWSEQLYQRTRLVKAQCLGGTWVPFSPPIEVVEDVQRRKCVRCGRLEARTVKSPT